MYEYRPEDIEKVRQALDQFVKESGDVYSAAKCLYVTPSYIFQVRSMYLPPGPAIWKGLGFELVIRFRNGDCELNAEELREFLRQQVTEIGSQAELSRKFGIYDTALNVALAGGVIRPGVYEPLGFTRICYLERVSPGVQPVKNAFKKTEKKKGRKKYEIWNN